jgi:hypothetical protein
MGKGCLAEITKEGNGLGGRKSARGSGVTVQNAVSVLHTSLECGKSDLQISRKDHITVKLSSNQLRKV